MYISHDLHNTNTSWYKLVAKNNFLCSMQVTTSSHIFQMKKYCKGNFNKQGKTMKEHDVVALQTDV